MLLFSLLTGEQRGGGVGLSSRTKLDRTGPSFSSTVVVFSFALSSGVFGIRRASGGVALNGGCLGSEKRFRDKAKSSLSASSTPFNSVWSLPPPFLYPPFPRPRPTDKPKDRSPPDGTRPSAEEQCLPRREGGREGQSHHFLAGTRQEEAWERTKRVVVGGRKRKQRVDAASRRSVKRNWGNSNAQTAFIRHFIEEAKEIASNW